MSATAPKLPIQAPMPDPHVEIVTFRGRRYAVIPLEDYERLRADVESKLAELRRLAGALDPQSGKR
jgi:hypothetical protein